MVGFRSPVRASLVLCAVIAVTLAACKKDAPVAPVAPAVVASKPVASGAPFLARIPSDALIVAVASGPDDLLARLGSKEVISALSVEYAKAAARTTLLMGHNLLDPTTWPAIGVDPKAPLGFAWLHVDDEAVALFATVSDPAKVRAFMDTAASRAGTKVEAELMGDATLLTAAGVDEAMAVLTKDAVYIVVCERGRAETRRQAERIATVGREASFAGSSRTQEALDSLAFGRDATLWIDVPAIVAAVHARVADRKREWAAPKHLEEDLARAKAEQDAAVVARIEENIRQQRENDERWRERDNAEVELMDALAGGLEGVMAGFEIDGAAIRVRARSQLREGSMLAKGLRSSSEVQPVVRSLSSRPLFVAGGSVAPVVALDVARIMARAEGDDLTEGFDELQGELGFDPRAVLLPVLDGRVGFAVTGDTARVAAAGDEGARLIGGTITLGVNDAEKARAALETLWASPLLARMVSKDKANGTARLSLPAWRDIHVAVVGDTIVATTDADALGRLGKPGRGDLLEAEGDGPVGRLLGADDSAALLAYDGRLGALLYLALRSDYAEPSPSLPVNATAELKAKLAEWTAARDKMEELREKREEVNNRAMNEIFGVVGLTAARARIEGGALVFEGAQAFDAPSVPAAAGRITQSVLDAVKQSDELGRLASVAQARASALRHELSKAEVDAMVREAEIRAVQPLPIAPPEPAPAPPQEPPPVP